jgi:tight adherence protein C
MISDRIMLLSALLSPAVLLVAGAIVLLLREAARQNLDARVSAVAASGRTASAAPSTPWFAPATGLVEKVGVSFRKGTRFYSEEGIAELDAMIEAAGMRPKRVLPMVLGGKIVLLILAPLAAYIYCTIVGYSPASRVLALALALPLAVLVPDWILRALRNSYRKALQRGVADALDLLVVCTEAGMGLESALEQVAKEIEHSNRPMAAALQKLVDELKVLPSAQEALKNFGMRSGVVGIRRMSAILAQTIQYGSPLGQALRAVANELRRERVIRLEERAIRLPALLVFPLIFLVLPAFFIVMAGGPILRMFELMHATHAQLGGM